MLSQGLYEKAARVPAYKQPIACRDCLTLCLEQFVFVFRLNIYLDFYFIWNTVWPLKYRANISKSIFYFKFMSRKNRKKNPDVTLKAAQHQTSLVYL